MQTILSSNAVEGFIIVLTSTYTFIDIRFTTINTGINSHLLFTLFKCYSRPTQLQRI